jgi:tRNA/rRNA methyltransferase/tRNA (cytidine32/uridine32-2'-O)-methyltransferase
MILSDIVIVLCRASEPGNVGAVCRVMKNMGLSQLRLVTPEFFDNAPLITRAIHAEDIWQNARFYDSLADATADCSIVVGTTRRRGRKRKSITMEPRALAAWLKKRHTYSLALVFGNERTGLNDDELNSCNIASHIPVSDAFPSLNLSHAVQIYTYEMFIAFGGAEENPVKGEWIPMELSAAEKLTADITQTLAGLGFYKYPGRKEQSRFLLDLICRAGLTEKEGRYLKDIFIKAARLGMLAVE